MLHNKDIEACRALGLTLSQAKVYLALNELGEAGILKISQTVQIARQDIYRVMAELEQRCIVEKVIATPTKFKATPISNAIPFLLQRIQHKTLEAQEKAAHLIKRHSNRGVKLKALEKEIKFVLISNKESLSRKLKKAIKSAQISVDLLCPRKKCINALFDLAESLQNALEKGVKIRWIINKPLKRNSKPAILEVLSESSMFKMKCVPHNSTQSFGIYDKKQILIASNPKLNYLYSSALWTNATPIVELAQNHFNTLWNKTKARAN